MTLLGPSGLALGEPPHSEQRRTMRHTFVAVVTALVVLSATAAPAAASEHRHAVITVTLTDNDCAMTDAAYWRDLPPIFEIDTVLNQDGHPFIVGASLIPTPEFQERDLDSPQTVETFLFGSGVIIFSYSVTFTFKDSRHRVVAVATS